jgi:hypothetical protein
MDSTLEGGVSLIERFVVGVDIERFSSRVTRRQVLLQRELDRMLDDAVEAAGTNREQWERRATGDGEVATLRADVDLLKVVRRFVYELDQRLADHNDDHNPEARIRLRVAMHIDVVTPGALGYAGPAFTVLQRLLDSIPVRAALAEASDANLALIISEPVYQKTVLQELGGLRPRQFKRVQVDLPAMDFHQTAYVYVPKDTLALLEAAGCSENGRLRTSDSRGLPDALFTEVNDAWARTSGGAWGFGAQRNRIDGLKPSAPAVSGNSWRRSGGAAVTRTESCRTRSSPSALAAARRSTRRCVTLSGNGRIGSGMTSGRQW